jgi:hypothetical protein
VRDLEALTVSAEDVVAETVVTAQNDEGTTVRIRLKAADLLAATPATGRRRTVSANAAVLRAPRLSHPLPLVRRRGARLFVITPVPDESGRLMISVVPLTPGRVVARLRSRLIRRRGNGRGSTPH